MRERFHAAVVIARRQVLETCIAPAFSITLAIGMALGYFTVASFTRAIDSSGFNAQLNPAFELMTRLVGAAFGSALVEKVFAEGPFLLAFAAALIPVFLYLAIASVFRFGMEKNAGAVELLAYGPADGTAYLLAAFLKDVLVILLAIIVVSLFLAVAAGIYNLVLGPLFLFSIAVLFLVTVAIFAYGILASTLTSNASSAIALFIGVLLLFLLIAGGSLTIASAPVRTIAGIASAILQWVSPFYYATLCLRAFNGGAPAGLVAGFALLFALTAGLLVLSHVVVRRKGVRA